MVVPPSQVLPLPGLSLVGKDAARQRTKSLQHAASHLCVWLSQCLFRMSARPSVLFVRLCPVHSVSIPGPRCGHLGLRYEPPHLAVLRSCRQRDAPK